MSDFREFPITRREALTRVGGAAAAVALTGCDSTAARAQRTSDGEGGTPATTASGEGQRQASTTERMPVVFLPHGGGPWPFIEMSFGAPDMWDQLETYLRELAFAPPVRPESVLVISAHWEEPVPTLMTAPRPPMLYDYYGFPNEAYEIEWPAPGQPELAERVRDLLELAGIRSGEDDARGFDHGTFVPLKVAWPAADMPTLQLSLKRGLDPAEHLAIGRALAPLRDEGIFIVGSGMSYHNMRGFRGGVGYQDSRRFDDWLGESMRREASARETHLVEWERAPAARACHPREEHLLPLMVVAGAAEDDAGSLPFSDEVMGVQVSAVQFG